jgi:hypothetical protein
MDLRELWAKDDEVEEEDDTTAGVYAFLTYHSYL